MLSVCMLQKMSNVIIVWAKQKKENCLLPNSLLYLFKINTISPTMNFTLYIYKNHITLLSLVYACFRLK